VHFLRLIALFLILQAVAQQAHAATYVCTGKVLRIMADHTCPNPDRLSYKTTGTGGTSGPWICTASPAADSLILAAALANKTVKVSIHAINGNTSCSNTSSYTENYYVQLDTEENGS